ncbi:GAP family protein [Rhizohabitans arisaemae]|uniref:GAP family protein n=1 Tax=Rhizohabitans arisaemae TaxID=2720610 RepID=UPI0024B0ABD2|nr:GAP family protein [Rhizohabitans arisaemae]
MNPGTLLALIGLALLDSTSIGTLFIPVWLLLSPGRINVGRILVYLGTVTAFYLGAGILLTLGAGPVIEAVGEAVDERTLLWGQLALGAGLFALSYRFDPKRRPAGGRITRWRERVTSDSGSPTLLMGLALIAALAEVATMLPYLAAIGLISTSELSLPLMIAVLAGYCLVMVVPAVILLGARLGAAARVEPLLGRIDTWITEKGSSWTGWALAIVGFMLTANAAVLLRLPPFSW